MKSPLAVDKETIKKFEISADVELSPIQKVSFLQTQLQELQGMMWRSRVDVIHATRLTESTNDTLKQRGHQQLATHLNEVQQFVGGIRMIKQMIEELRKEYPELLQAEE